ncbi:MAG: diguanylate cyclase [Nitrosomonas sp.]|nr:MAG: diguanylate cyclase [Nitrosomonas sp.]
MQNLISAVSYLKLFLRECSRNSNYLIIIVSTIFIFIVDLNLPLGIAAGAPYVLVVFASLWVSGIRASYLVATLGIGFTIAAFFLSPGSDASMHTILINRAMTLLLIVCSAIMVIKIKKADIDIATLTNQPLLDPITGFKNDQALTMELGNEIQRCKRYNRQLSLAIIEIDHSEPPLRSIESPDIRKVSQEIKTNIRITDYPYHINPDALAIIFTETNLIESKSVCESICKQVSTKQNKQYNNRIDIKIGIAALDKSDNATALLQRAQEALDQAKASPDTSVATLPQVADKEKTSVAAILLRSRIN